MRIQGWECTLGEGGTRAATHPDNGNAVLLKNGRLMGSCDMPPEVLRWVLRPMLREQWEAGYIERAFSRDGETPAGPSPENPWEGEPVDKGKEPS